MAARSSSHEPACASPRSRLWGHVEATGRIPQQAGHKTLAPYEGTICNQVRGHTRRRAPQRQTSIQQRCIVTCGDSSFGRRAHAQYVSFGPSHIRKDKGRNPAFSPHNAGFGPQFSSWKGRFGQKGHSAARPHAATQPGAGDPVSCLAGVAHRRPILSQRLKERQAQTKGIIGELLSSAPRLLRSSGRCSLVPANG